MKDEKAVLLQQALAHTEQLLQERDVQVSQTQASYNQALESIAHHAATIMQLEQAVATLEGHLTNAQAASLQLQQELELKQAEFDAEKEAAAAAAAEINLQLQMSRDDADEVRSTVVLLQQQLADASDTCEAMREEQAALVQCIAAAAFPYPSPLQRHHRWWQKQLENTLESSITVVAEAARKCARTFHNSGG